MKLRIGVLFALSALGGGRLAAQPAAAPTSVTTTVTDSVAKAFVGTWEGPYTSDHAPPGSIRMVIARDTAWKATVGISSEMAIPIGPVTDFMIKANKVTWTQDIMGMSCSGAATLAEGAMSGGLACGHVDLPFILKKK